MKISNIAVHHFAGTSDPYAKTQNFSEATIENAHRANGFSRASTGYYIGYNAIIWPSGEIKWYRPIGEQTCAQRGHNSDTVSICLAGNFTLKPDGVSVEVPTIAQCLTLKNTLATLVKSPTLLPYVPGTIFDMSITNIRPHRLFTGNSTSCYGNSLPNSWARDIVSPYLEPQTGAWRALLNLYRSLLDSMQRNGRSLQGDDFDCPSHV